MKRISRPLLMAFAASGLSFCLLACNNGADESANNADSVNNAGNNAAGGSQQYAEATLSGTFPDTTVTGTVQFEQMDNGQVKMTLNITAPQKANKSVAVHLHEHGTCADTAMAAGGHWNPTGTNHGQWGEGSFHAGDIGNISLDGEGKATKELETDLWSIGGDASKNILNKTVMVHGGVDDYTSQPSGNSGPRIGCGVITARNR